MSKTLVTIERVNEVSAHPNADRLEMIQVLGYRVAVGKGDFIVGDLVVYFPPDILIPERIADVLNVTKYLKHAILPGDTEKSQCRVAATRLRGVPSHGFCVSVVDDWAADSVLGPLEPGRDVTHLYNAHKYEPPVRLGAGDAEKEVSAFHRYTNIENIQRYPNAFKETDDIIITEKLHGTNCRLGLIKENDEFVFCAGSHNVRRKMGGLYWEFMTEKVMNLLSFLVDEQHSVIVFGEIFGAGVQDLDYGRSERAFRVFDISVNGEYMSYWEMVTTCDQFGLLCVPQLHAGVFSPEIVEEHTYGPTTFAGVKSKFKDREGCVVRPRLEAYSDVLGKRLILKSVSADYRDRKNAKDIGE